MASKLISARNTMATIDTLSWRKLRSAMPQNVRGLPRPPFVRKPVSGDVIDVKVIRERQFEK